MNHLYLIRGLPGSGKSTLARKLSEAMGAMHLEADAWHMREVDGEQVYDWQPHRVGFAHSECQRMCEIYMGRRLSVVVSNTFTTEKELRPYLDLALTYRYDSTVVIVENRHGNESIHDVPSETMQKMRDRFSVKL